MGDEWVETNPELVGKASDFAMHIRDVIESFEMEAGEDHPQMASLLELFSGKLEPVLEQRDRLKGGARFRIMREEDSEKLRKGTDPGLHIRLATRDDVELNINAFGGMRFVGGSMDFYDGTGAVNKESSSTDRTLDIASQNTEVNVNLQKYGRTYAECWLVFGPKDSGRAFISRLMVDDGEVLHEATGRVSLQGATADFLGNSTRTKLKDLSRFRPQL